MAPQGRSLIRLTHRGKHVPVANRLAVISNDDGGDAPGLAAREAAILGLPAVAISQYVARHRTPDWERSILRAAPVLHQLLERPRRPGHDVAVCLSGGISVTQISLVHSHVTGHAGGTHDMRAGRSTRESSAPAWAPRASLAL